MVRKIAIRILKKQGFHVYQAESGKDALQLVEREKPHIDLLLTDIVMAEYERTDNWPKKMAEAYPEMKVLFTSGYTEDVIAQHGILEEGINFIAKPYSPQCAGEEGSTGDVRKERVAPYLLSQSCSRLPFCRLTWPDWR